MIVVRFEVDEEEDAARRCQLHLQIEPIGSELDGDADDPEEDAEQHAEVSRRHAPLDDPVGDDDHQPDPDGADADAGTDEQQPTDDEGYPFPEVGLEAPPRELPRFGTHATQALHGIHVADGLLHGIRRRRTGPAGDLPGHGGVHRDRLRRAEVRPDHAVQSRRAGALQSRDDDDLAQIDIADFGALPQELLNAQGGRPHSASIRPGAGRGSRSRSMLPLRRSHASLAPSTAAMAAHLCALWTQRIEFAQLDDSGLWLRMRFRPDPAEAHGARRVARGIDPVR